MASHEKGKKKKKKDSKTVREAQWRVNIPLVRDDPIIFPCSSSFALHSPQHLEKASFSLLHKP